MRLQPLPTWDDLVAAAREADIDRLGVAPAHVLTRARTALIERKHAGLHNGMGFTYRNPERSTDPQRAVADARCVIVAARSYRLDDEPERPQGSPQASVARYAWVDHYAPLRAGLRGLAHQIRAAGFRAVAFADDNSIVDREVAYLGGLGWFGKNANVLVDGAGSFFVLGSIVTTAEYPISTPVGDGCGTCRRCIDACPTGAIVADGVIDANRCLAWLVQKPGTFPVEYRRALGDRLYGCDDCQTSCPISVRLGRRHRRSADATSDAIGVVTGGATGAVQAWVDVLGLLDATDAELLDRYGRWYLADRDPKWWRRNALIVLGNTGDATDRHTRRVLATYRADPDEILREHAQWASATLGIT